MALVLAIVGVNSFALAIPSVVVGSLFLDLSFGEGLLWTLNVEVTGGLGIGVALLLYRRTFEPLRRWSAGDRTDPAALLDLLLRLPQLLASMVLPAVLASQLVLGFPFVVWLGRPGGQGVIGLFIAYVLVTAAIAVLTTTIAQLLVRTAVVELGRATGRATSTPARWWTLRRRLVITIAVLCGLAGVITSAVVLGTSATENDYLVAILGGVAWGAYIGVFVDLVLIGPVLAPLDELTAATIRVRRGIVDEPVPVLVADELGELATAFNEMQAGLRERAALHAAFGSYVDPLLAQRLLASGSSVFDGEELEVTVMFADVRDFTAFSEQVPPADAVAKLNRLFDVVVPIVQHHGGHANHYLGDGLLAVFGAPGPLPSHADAAVAAAVEIQIAVRAAFGDDLRLGIGINTGPVIAGTVGGGGRHEFTVIGDTVNTASRVEQLTKQTGDRILLTAATVAALTAPRPSPTARGEFALHGRQQVVAVHAIDPFGSRPAGPTPVDGLRPAPAR